MYEFALEVLGVFRQMPDERWDQLMATGHSIVPDLDVARILRDTPYGHKVIGGAYPGHHAYLPGLIARVMRERDFPETHRKKQERFIAFSIAAEGRIQSRDSRRICREEEIRRAGISGSDQLPSTNEGDDVFGIEPNDE